MEKYLMTIDAGTGSVRAVIFDLKGNEIGCSSNEWFHKEDPRYKGSMDFDIDFNWALTCKCIKDALEKSKIKAEQILGVTSTSMREAIVLYDKNMKEIWACANVDSRAVNEVGVLKKNYPELEKEIYNLTGQTFALGSIPRLLWIKNNTPEIYNKIYKISMLNDWILFKLSGVISTEPSNSCTTGIFNIKTLKWDENINKKCQLNEDIFPKIYSCGENLGVTSLEIEELTGLKKGTPIFVGGGDAQLGGVGIGLVYPNQGGIFGGSFWQYEYNTTNPKLDPNYRVRLNCHAINDMWQYEAIAFFPGLIMRWYRDAFCQEEKEESKKTGEDAYSIISKKAVNVPPGSNGIMCTFSNVMNFINWRHASPTFTNFSFDSESFNKYTFFRAIMENSCYVTKGHLDLIKGITGDYPKEVIFASGASKSSIWCQILADILETKVKVPKVKEATALGGAILCSVGAGIYSNIQEACENMIQIEKVYEPNKELKGLYNELYSKWREIYSHQLELADRKVTNHMWIAPGL